MTKQEYQTKIISTVFFQPRISSLFAFLFLFFWIPLTSVFSIEISRDQLEKILRDSIHKVSAFEALKKIAENHGVRLWLFGGTASSFGYYAVWDFEAHNDPNSPYLKEKFDYDYPSIYRSTQDADIVVDGPPEMAELIEAQISQHQSALKGEKQRWEVRSLRQWRGSKEPLLGDINFQMQHSDSASVGLIEITEPPPNSSIIKDLRHWDEADPPFAKGLRNKSIILYPSDQHEETPRYKRGDNPPIFEALRFLTKAFQYELKMSPDDLKTAAHWISDFLPAKDLSTNYAKAKFNELALKMYMNAANKNFAYHVIKTLGLEKKIQLNLGIIDHLASELHFAPNAEMGGSQLSFWMKREPLPAFEVGKGSGKTAKQLGITHIAHSTKEFVHYEALTASPKGYPNAFVAEVAAFGPGFYTMKGDKGAWDTGLNIRYEVLPNAREGSDFTLFDYQFGTGVLMLNQNAFRVIPEVLALSLYEFFNLFYEQRWTHDDLGLFKRFIRRINADPNQSQLNKDQKKDIEKKILKLFEREKKWLKLSHSLWSEALQDISPLQFLRTIGPINNIIKIVEARQNLKIADHGNIVEAAQKAGSWFPLHPEMIFDVFEQSDDIALKVLIDKLYSEHSFVGDKEIQRSLIDHPQFKPRVARAYAEKILTNPPSVDSEILDLLFKRKDQFDRAAIESLIHSYLSKKHSEPRLKEWIPYIWSLNSRDLKIQAITEVFSSSHSHSMWQWLMEAVSKEQDIFVLRAIASKAFPAAPPAYQESMKVELRQKNDAIISLSLGCDDFLATLMGTIPTKPTRTASGAL